MSGTRSRKSIPQSPSPVRRPGGNCHDDSSDCRDRQNPAVIQERVATYLQNPRWPGQHLAGPRKVGQEHRDDDGHQKTDTAIAAPKTIAG